MDPDGHSYSGFDRSWISWTGISANRTGRFIEYPRSDASAAQRWALNGQDLGAVTGPLLWEPVAGKHTLSLVDDEGRVLDTVRFEVRPPLMTGDLPPSATR